MSAVLVGVLLVSGCSSSPPRTHPLVPPVTHRAASQPLTGKIVWHDLLTHDPDRAAEFYGALFGWTFEAPPDSRGRYWNVSRDGEVIAGMFAADPEEVEAPLWLMSVSVPDADRFADTAVALGGSLVLWPADLPDRGRYAAIQDPQGAFLVLLHSSAGDPPDGAPLGAGDWLWTELWTTDAQAAVRFYEDLLGYRPESLAGRLGSGDTYQEGEPTAASSAVFFGLCIGKTVRAGVHQLPGEATPSWLPYVAVSDPAGLVERAVALGGQVLLPPEAVANHEAAILIDPTGAPFGVQQWPRPEGGDR